jgi:hypothetical protein
MLFILGPGGGVEGAQVAREMVVLGIELEQTLGARPDMETRRAVLEELVRDWEVLQKEEPGRIPCRLHMAGSRAPVVEGQEDSIGLG